MGKMKVSLIFGTRPEAIKLCPLVLALRAHGGFDVKVCVTGQHRQMLDQVLDVFGIKPDADLALMRPNQSLDLLTSRAIESLGKYLDEHAPKLVIVQGDTTTAFCAALSAFYHRVAVAHVEAGLRTGNKQAPFPEEINRVLTSRLADFHFAPTAGARQNLLREGVSPDCIFVTGNTVIDALHFAVAKARELGIAALKLPEAVVNISATTPMVLITGHRRENFGSGFERICQAVARLAEMYPNVAFVYPVHLNPNVREPVFRLLSRQPNIHLIEPLDYLPFVALLERCTLVLTDSGGIQEEAPSLGKPVLIMRDTTERPEAVEAGTARLVGTETSRIVDSVSSLLTDSAVYEAMARARNPYGDGQACRRIVDVLERMQ